MIAKLNTGLRAALGLIVLGMAACAPTDNPSSAAGGSANGVVKQPSATAPKEPSLIAAGAPTKVPSVEAEPKTPTTSEMAPAAAPASDKLPELVVPTQKIDFGLQPANKSLNRAFTIKNDGKAELKINAVEPS